MTVLATGGGTVVGSHPANGTGAGTRRTDHHHGAGRPGRFALDS